MAYPGIVPNEDGASSQNAGELRERELARESTGHEPREARHHALVRFTLNPNDVEPSGSRKPGQRLEVLRRPILAHAPTGRVYRHELQRKSSDAFVALDARRRCWPFDSQRLESLHQMVARMNPVRRQWRRLDELDANPLQLRRQKRHPRPRHHAIESPEKIEKLRLFGTILKERMEHRPIDRMRLNSESRPKRKLNVGSRPHHLDPSPRATESRDRRKRNNSVAKRAGPDRENTIPQPVAPISRVAPSPNPVPVPVCVPESIPAKWNHAQVFF